jgi:hypothetical protein
MATVLWVVIGVASLAMLAVPTVALPSDSRGLLRRFVTPEIVPDLRISQTFQMTGRGLRAVEFQPTAIGPVSGVVRIELHDVTAHDDTLLQAVDVRAADLVRTQRYQFDFPPIANSSARTYQLDLTSPESSPAHGIAVWATKGTRYSGGTMLIDGEPRWADLAFRAEAPAPSTWDLLRRTDALTRDVVFAAGGVAWLALGLVVRALTTASQGTAGR